MAQTLATTHTTRVKTGVVQLGYNALYRPVAFKNDAKDKKKGETENKPKFNLTLSFDKTDPNAKAFIKQALAAQKAAIQNSIDDGEWDETASGQLAFRDADKVKVQTSPTDKRLIILSDKRPQYRGMYVLTAKAKADRRPNTMFLTGDGRFLRLPDPILDPDPDDPDKIAESNRIADIWNQLVFEGQNAIVSFTFNAYRLPTGTQGTSARIDNILILGGGTRVGTVAFDTDFGDPDELTKLIAWRKKYTPDYTPELDPWDNEGRAITSGKDDDVDVQVVDDEDSETDDDAEEIPAPRRRTARKPQTEPEYDEETGEVADDGTEEERPRHRAHRTASSRRPLRKPADVEPDDEFAGEDEFADDGDIM